MLVIQVPVESLGDFDRLLEAETRMSTALQGTAEIDGHDAGSGEGNIFVRTDTPEVTFQKALPCLDERATDLVRAAFREIEGDRYTVLWPPGLTLFRVL
jgi:hypothetical protein